MMLGFGSGIKRIAVLGVLIMPVACGFRLAGFGNLPPAMQSTYLVSSEPRSEFHASLVEALRQRGLTIVDSRDEAGAMLSISEDLTGQDVLSVTARNVAREYEVWYSVTFSLEAEGRNLVENESLYARRNYSFDETRLLGKEREEAEIRAALADDLARRVVRRIEAATRTAG